MLAAKRRVSALHADCGAKASFADRGDRGVEKTEFAQPACEKL
jgi:hypothetical protein